MDQNQKPGRRTHREDGRIARRGWGIGICALVLVSLCGCSGLLRSQLYDISDGTDCRAIEVYTADISPERRQKLAKSRAARPFHLSTSVPPGLRTFRQQGIKSERVAQRRQERVAAALAVLDDGVVKRLVSTSNAVLKTGIERGSNPNRGAGTRVIDLPTDRAGWSGLSTKLENAALTDAWSELAGQCRAYAAHLEGQPTVDRVRLLETRRLERTTHYVMHYVKAYFTGVALIEIQVDLKKLTKRLKDEIRERLAKLDPNLGTDEFEAKVTEMLRAELKLVLKQLLKDGDYAKIDEIVTALVDDGVYEFPVGYRLAKGSETEGVGFTSRAGENFKWPTIELKVDPSAADPLAWSDVNATKIGAQLVRVFLEALFDAQLGVPGAGTATAVSFPKNYRLAKFFDGLDGVTTAELDLLDDWSGQAEGIASSAIGRLIRGIGWISLNNESLATLIETAVGVSTRKLVEVALWERFAEGDGQGVYALERGDFVKISFRFESLSRPSDR